MKPQDFTLGLLPPLNSGMTSLSESGQHTRLVNEYLSTYAKTFPSILYFSYFQEDISHFTEDPIILDRVKLLPGDRTRSYTFTLPFRWEREMHQCHVFRVFQITGVIPAIIAKLRWRIPYVATYGYRYAQVARTEGKLRRTLLLWFLEQFGLRTANAIIVTTPALAEHVLRVNSRAHICQVPNGVDTNLFHSTPTLPGQRHLIFVGRLEPQKNLFTLIEALSHIQPKPRLTIVGEGSLRERIRRAAVEQNVNLELIGVVQNEQLPNILRTADAFVLPSLIEGHPKALLEAMSCALPCVGLDVTGTQDVLIHEETGILCPPSAEGLAQGIRRVLDDVEFAIRLGRHARTWIETNYDLSALLQREVMLLQTIAQRRN